MYEFSRILNKLETMERDAQILILGHTGMVGSSLLRHFDRQGYKKIVGASSKEVDLTSASQTQDFISKTKPDVVILAAAKVGGILSNKKYPTEFLLENLSIQTNVITASHQSNVSKLVFFGSSCIYPKFAHIPIEEASLLTGSLEETNKSYAIAKIAGVTLIDALRSQFGRKYITVMPTSLYGPGDNFDKEYAHVIPAMIRKFIEAKDNGVTTVQFMGDGSPLREFLYVDDLARAIEVAIDKYDDYGPLNIGSSSEVSIAELAELIKSLVGFEGEILWDTESPNGTLRKLIDSRRIHALGWEPSVSLREGLINLIQWYKNELLLRKD